MVTLLAANSLQNSIKLFWVSEAPVTRYSREKLGADESIYGYNEEEGSQEAPFHLPQTSTWVPQRFHILLGGELKEKEEWTPSLQVKNMPSIWQGMKYWHIDRGKTV